FEHSLGAYKLVCDIIDSMKKRKNRGSNYDSYGFRDAELKVGALLHDIGHYSLSHIGEHCFNDFINSLPVDVGFDEIKKVKIPKHNERAASMILGRDVFLNLKKYYDLDITLTLPFWKLFSIINKNADNKNEKIRILKIAKLINPEKYSKIGVGNLINGPLDVDKLDYILRESYFTGTPFGVIDLHRIIKGYMIGNIIKEGKLIKNQLVFNKRMLPSILQMYMGRQFNYLTISYHKTVRIAETMLKSIVDVVMKEFFNKFQNRDDIVEILKKIFFHFKLMEDRDFFHFLEIICQLSP
ncbi:unnamed protein product, partial [marine sediment metagenome]